MAWQWKACVFTPGLHTAGRVYPKTNGVFYNNDIQVLLYQPMGRLNCYNLEHYYRQLSFDVRPGKKISMEVVIAYIWSNKPLPPILFKGLSENQYLSS